jgi:hypothetical protein
MKHPYTAGCNCARCARELVRRSRQADSNPTTIRARFSRIRCTRRQPIVGSQEWAETRGDDLGPSGDY